MEKSGITNNHLKRVLNEVQNSLDNGNEIPHELFIDFIAELKYSNLLVAGIIDGDELIYENMTSDDGTKVVIPLYTDDDEFIASNGEDYEYSPIENDIGFYIEILNDEKLNGVLINYGSQDFFIDLELLNEIPLTPVVTTEDNLEGYDADTLKEIAENVTNDSLVEFMKSGSEHFEALMLELAKAILLNVVSSDESLDSYAQNGIIKASDVEYDLCTTSDGENEYCILFTDLQAIMDTKGEGNYYYQIALLDDFMELALRSDMEGIIINPGSDDYLISREYLIEAFGTLCYNNPKFKRAPDYIFML